MKTKRRSEIGLGQQCTISTMQKFEDGLKTVMKKYLLTEQDFELSIMKETLKTQMTLLSTVKECLLSYRSNRKMED